MGKWAVLQRGSWEPRQKDSAFGLSISALPSLPRRLGELGSPDTHSLLPVHQGPCPRSPTGAEGENGGESWRLVTGKLLGAQSGKGPIAACFPALGEATGTSPFRERKQTIPVDPFGRLNRPWAPTTAPSAPTDY